MACATGAGTARRGRVPELLQVNYVGRPTKGGEADTSGVGFSDGFGEIEGRFLGVLDEVS